MPTMIEFEQVSKEYRLGTGATDLREGLADLARRWLPGAGGRPAGAISSFWALRDVSFAVERGQALGIIGPNGAGKTTVLKLLSGITRPTSGRLHVTGRLSSLIELGAGFHPDLTGRENVYLNGVILGLSRREIDALFDQIVDFAGLARFIDTPVKRYSSGMYARLGFSVAAHVSPDVLLVDEVLSVGDIAFQNKCADHMQRLRQRGTTIVFISHNLHAMLGICDRCVVLDQGQIRFAGPTDEAVRSYQHLTRSARARAVAPGPATAADTRRPADIVEVDVFDTHGQRRDTFAMGEAVLVRIHYDAHQPIQAPLFSAGLLRSDGLNVCSNTARDQYEPAVLDGPGVVELVIPAVTLIPDTYTIVTSICEGDSLRPYVTERLASFQVTSPDRYIDHHYGVFLPDFRWRAAAAPGRALVGSHPSAPAE